jgi:hypothetical protein
VPFGRNSLGSPTCVRINLQSCCRVRMPPSGSRSVGSGNHENSGVACPIAGAICYDLRGSRIDADYHRTLGNDIDLCSRCWAERGTRWIRRPWRRTRWSLVGAIFCWALLSSFDWALFRTHLQTSRPRSQSGGAKRSSTGARGSSAEESVRVPATARARPPAQSFRLWRMSLRMARL